MEVNLLTNSDYFELYNVILNGIIQEKLYRKDLTWDQIYFQLAKANEKLFLMLQDKYSPEDVIDELIGIIESMKEDKIIEAKIIKIKGFKRYNSDIINIDFVTRKGRDYLEIINSETIMNKLKKRVKEEGLKLSISTISFFMTEFLKQKLNLL